MSFKLFLQGLEPWKFHYVFVIRSGLEPETLTLKVLCSTN